MVNIIVKIFLKLNLKIFLIALSMHTIYHIDKKLQKKVVERLIEISKINKPIIIVYSNPNILLKKNLYKVFQNYKEKSDIYFYCHSNKWWMQFEGKAQVFIVGDRYHSASKKLIPQFFW